jgi:hypothetical protein
MGGGNNGDKLSSSKKLKELTTTIKDHVMKMVSAAKMKCVQHEKDCNYAIQVEVPASLCSLSAERRQMTVQMKAEMVKKKKVMEKSLSTQLQR